MNASELKESWQDFLGRYPFTHSATYTFRHETPLTSAQREWRQYVHRVNRSLFGRRWYLAPERSLCFASAVEGQRDGQRLHIHALLAPPTRCDQAAWVSLARAQWRCGYCQVRAITERAGAIRYLLKERHLNQVDITCRPPQASDS